jgi:cytosol alanyl aminopeptidase
MRRSLLFNLRGVSPLPRCTASASRAALALACLLVAGAGCEPSAPPPPAPSRFQPQPAPPPPSAPLPAEEPPTGRLPADVRPSYGHLALTIAPERQEFSGSVEIAVTLERPRDVIWLHGQGLHVERASVRLPGRAPIDARWEQVTEAGLAALRLPFALPAGQAMIHIDYAAPFGAHQEGLYHLENRGMHYAVTQFEAIFARRTLPCFDEPAFKVPWDVTLFAPEGQVAIANARLIEQAPAAAGLVRHTFATTPPLPSYLLAFAVGPFDVVTAPLIPPNAVRKRPLVLRGVAPAGRGKELGYALARTGEILAALEGYVGLEYPYDKLDIIAVPQKSGAMENPGAITFGERILLFDERSATEPRRFRAMSVIAHELGHQWFGDLVTMPWWDDIWLNEAFASWIEPRVLGALDPTLDAEARSLASGQAAMNTDALASARQVRQAIRDDNDIANAFDAITYNKGSAVIGMFERWIGPEVFRKGINAYLREHTYGSATEADLLSALSAAAGRDVATPFRSFIFQPGVPLVEANLTCAGGKAALSLRQSRFVPTGSSVEPSQTFQIPVCARYPDGEGLKEACSLLTEREGSLPLEGKGCPAWVMPNADASGYYRWALSAADLGRLASAGYARLTTRERMSLGESVYASFSRASMPAGDALRALEKLAVDPSHLVAAEPMRLIASIGRFLDEDREMRKAMEAYGQRLYGPAYRALGWEPKKGKTDGAAQVLLRRAVVEFMALEAREPEARKEAMARARAYLGLGKDGALHAEAVVGDLADVALAVLGEDADEALFSDLLARLEGAKTESLRAELLRAIGAVRRPALATRARELAVASRVRPREALGLLEAQFAAPELRAEAWAWTKDHLDAVMAILPPSRATAMIELPGAFCDEAHAEELYRVFHQRAQSIDGGPRAFASAVESMSLCVALRKVQEPGARAFFKAGAKAGAKASAKAGD